MNIRNGGNVFENFLRPDGRFRGRPFWAWNTEVTADKVVKQVNMFADMGFGGFVIHSRNGLRTEYMGERFMEMVKLSVRCARERGLKVWLYDEDRWPSGSAGGLVTRDHALRQRSLVITVEKPHLTGLDYAVAAYDVKFDGDGYLSEYSVRNDGEGDIYAYVHVAEDSPRFNGQANVDVLNARATERFIDVTYEKYYSELGEYFGNTVEAIFTDEPHGVYTVFADHSDIQRFSGAELLWTDDFPETYKARFGEDILQKLPEVLWDVRGRYSAVRYRYHEHCAQRFKEAYSEPLGKWCSEHGIKFTGHFLLEQELGTQARATKDVMRCYADQDITGMDNLEGKYELATAVQCRSVAHQKGHKWVMSELYGVNNWDTDFRDYLHQGNWQAALGVDIRIHHLSWMSMLGEGKRDYPATFGYQSPWYLEHGKIEDHFSRLHAVLSEGAPCVKVGVIHPVESFWLTRGAGDRTGRICAERDKNFAALFEWLLYDGIDFDLINEALLPTQIHVDGGGAFVGEMRYEAIVIPDCITLRKTTLDALIAMKQNGVRIIFAGGIPSLLDGEESGEVSRFVVGCEHVEYTYGGIAGALMCWRAFELTDKSGAPSDRYVHQMRMVDGRRWLFLSPARKIEDKENSAGAKYQLKLSGECRPVRFDTVSGKIVALEYGMINGNTVVELTLYQYDTVLLCLDGEGLCAEAPTEYEGETSPIPIPNTVDCRRLEDNVLLLDMAEYSLDGENFALREEVLAVDTLCRKELGLPSVTGKTACQPWSVKEDEEHDLWLRFGFDSLIDADCRLAFERAREIAFNGEYLCIDTSDSYVDDDIKAVDVKVRRGKNTVLAKIAIGKTVGAEPMYLIGDFDVDLRGTEASLICAENKANFGSIVFQGKPFYGGSINYGTDILLQAAGALRISANYYRGEFLKVMLDGRAVGDIITAPYSVTVQSVSAGIHRLEIVCVGNRHNTFGSLHWGINDPYYGPAHWHKTGDAFSREYRLRDFGIMKCPRVELIKK